MAKSIAHFSAARIIISSILFTIALGTLLLSLPACQAVPLSLMDVFFTATSSICVCGLATVPLSSFTFIGHCIILFLMQIGGLSLVTLTLFLLSVFMKMGFRSKIMAGQLLELESWQKFKTILYFTIGITMFTELVGALLIYISIFPYYTVRSGVFLSIFHAVSAFCHVGFTLFPEDSLFWSHNYLFLLTSSAIMFIGSLGFLTWHDIAHYFNALRKKRHAHLSLYSKLVVVMSVILIGGGALLYWILERHNTFQGMSSTGQFINAIFNAISSRGAGFHTVYIPDLTLPTLVVIMLLSFIGSSPGSTGSGIKSTTVALIYGTVRAAVHGKKQVTLFNRTIARDQIYRAMAIFFLSAGWVLLITFCLLITESGYSFIDILFETIASFATLGLSTGITPLLSLTGKFFIILSMIVGRIGVIGFVFALQKRSIEATSELSYPEERIMMG